jgi:hypothetical protein
MDIPPLEAIDDDDNGDVMAMEEDPALDLTIPEATEVSLLRKRKSNPILPEATADSLRRKRESMMTPDELDSLRRALKEMKRRYTDAMASREELENKYDELSMFWEHRWRPFDIEVAIVREVLPGMGVFEALTLASTLKAVRHLVNTWDEMWHNWFLEDFPEVGRDLSPDAPGLLELPLWIMEGNKGSEDSRYAAVPWRRYYAWWAFFRRRALREIHMEQRVTAQRFIDNQLWIDTPVAQWPLNTKVEMGVGWEILDLVMPFAAEMCNGSGHSYALGDDSENWYFPERMFMSSGGVVESYAFPDENTIPLTNEARSPIFWMMRYAGAHATKSVTEWYNERSYVPKHDMRKGSTGYPQHKMVTDSKLNFDYTQALRGFCSWYAANYRGPDINRRGNGQFVPSLETVAPIRNEAVYEEILMELPPAPMVDKVWFLGKPLCVGCNAQGEPKQSVCCKRCGSTYCSAECQASTWQKQCGGCTKNKE